MVISWPESMLLRARSRNVSPSFTTTAFGRQLWLAIEAAGKMLWSRSLKALVQITPETTASSTLRPCAGAPCQKSSRMGSTARKQPSERAVPRTLAACAEIWAARRYTARATVTVSRKYGIPEICPATLFPPAARMLTRAHELISSSPASTALAANRQRRRELEYPRRPNFTGPRYSAVCGSRAGALAPQYMRSQSMLPWLCLVSSSMCDRTPSLRASPSRSPCLPSKCSASSYRCRPAFAAT
mmetsp:Transcript_50113/g.149643  ORF Transcript_50113/g.149643 Transcript_50113/m.149643 type:complete len:243 (+) Transcript_50113:616-1344(+)